jgi:hypothetical protein
MSKLKITVVILSGAVNGALGACILVWPAQGAILAAVIGVITMAVAAYTGMNLKPSA